jgi:hypothetical protein
LKENERFIGTWIHGWMFSINKREKAEGIQKNGQPRDTDNIRYKTQNENKQAKHRKIYGMKMKEYLS